MCYSRWVLIAGIGSLLAIAACSTSNNNAGPFGGVGSAGKSGAGGSDGVGSNGGDGAGQGGAGGEHIPIPEQGGEGNEGYKDCVTGPDQDNDNDGWTVAQGDCNDCNPSINPGAFDVPGDGEDNDCNGIVDDEVTQCDAGLLIDDGDPFNAARAMELCRTTTLDATGKDKTWGVISAKYVKADGTEGMNPMSRGLLPRFGATEVWQGRRMLALSSGTARAPGQPGYESAKGFKAGTASAPPEGYPKESPACPGIITGECKDPAALELLIRAPTNAKSFSFNLNFFTYEFPMYICTKFNDFYVTMMWPKPASLNDNNVSFDAAGNPISVNNGLLQVCVPQTVKSPEPGFNIEKAFDCPKGPNQLQWTGFDENMPAMGFPGPHAATGWLVTQVSIDDKDPDYPIIKLRFAIWDSGDDLLDSTVLIDNFQWALETVDSVGTKPSPPK